MKKYVLKAFILIAVLCTALTVSACGKSASVENGKQTVTPRSETTHKAGDTLSGPEKVFDTSDIKELYIRFTLSGNDTENQELEYALNQVTDDTYVLYATSGTLKGVEVVYEVNDDEIKKYTRTALNEKFKTDDTVGQSELESEIDMHMGMISLITSGLGDKNQEYKKKDDYNSPFTGDAYAYDIYISGEKTAEFAVDKKTGLTAKLKMEDGSANVTLEEYKLGGYDIPEYK